MESREGDGCEFVGKCSLLRQLRANSKVRRVYEALVDHYDICKVGGDDCPEKVRLLERRGKVEGRK